MLIAFNWFVWPCFVFLSHGVIRGYL
jgi:hypothetical protein